MSFVFLLLCLSRILFDFRSLTSTGLVFLLLPLAYRIRSGMQEMCDRHNHNVYTVIMCVDMQGDSCYLYVRLLLPHCTRVPVSVCLWIGTRWFGYYFIFFFVRICRYIYCLDLMTFFFVFGIYEVRMQLELWVPQVSYGQYCMCECDSRIYPHFHISLLNHFWWIFFKTQITSPSTITPWFLGLTETFHHSTFWWISMEQSEFQFNWNEGKTTSNHTLENTMPNRWNHWVPRIARWDALVSEFSWFRFHLRHYNGNCVRAVTMSTLFFIALSLALFLIWHDKLFSKPSIPH